MIPPGLWPALGGLQAPESCPWRCRRVFGPCGAGGSRSLGAAGLCGGAPSGLGARVAPLGFRGGHAGGGGALPFPCGNDPGVHGPEEFLVCGGRWVSEPQEPGLVFDLVLTAGSILESHLGVSLLSECWKDRRVMCCNGWSGRVSTCQYLC